MNDGAVDTVFAKLPGELLQDMVKSITDIPYAETSFGADFGVFEIIIVFQFNQLAVCWFQLSEEEAEEPGGFHALEKGFRTRLAFFT